MAAAAPGGKQMLPKGHGLAPFGRLLSTQGAMPSPSSHTHNNPRDL